MFLAALQLLVFRLFNVSFDALYKPVIIHVPLASVHRMDANAFKGSIKIK